MAEEQTDAPKKKSKAKWIILIIILLLGAGGGAAWYFFGDKLLGNEEAEPDAEQQQVVQSKGPDLSGPVVALPVFRVNLADPLGKRFIKLVVEVQLNSKDAAAQLDAQKAAVQDSIIMLLSSKSFADISTVESKILLKGEIAQRLNQILGGPKVTQVFFTDIVIQ